MRDTYWLDDRDHVTVDPRPFAGTGRTLCLARGVGAGLVCNRDRGHTGRHMILTLDASPPYVTAAWPGDHPPAEADR